MSYHLKAFPILYLNLGGEMMYIIEQRLQAQEITTDKTAKGGRQFNNLKKLFKLSSLNVRFIQC